MFANIYIEFEAKLVDEINSKFTEIGLEKNCYSLQGIDIDLIDSEIEVHGYDRLKGEEFVLFYDYQCKKGRLQYYNGDIEPIKV